MKEKKVPSIFILVDSLNVGGIERLSLDESYWLKAANINSSVLVLGIHKQSTTIMDVDDVYFTENKINIVYLGKNKLTQLRSLVKLFKKTSKKSIVVSHSAGGIGLIFLSKILTFKKIRAFLWIHQAITLSKRAQANKRIFYSLFAEKIFFGARHFQIEWTRYISRSIWKVFYYKKSHFDRIGVFLPRVNWEKHEKVHFCDNHPQVSHIIFASRMTSWKGFEKFQDICDSLLNREIHSIVMRVNSGEISNKSNKVDEFEHTAVNLSPSNIHTNNRLVHFYPTNYGNKVRYPQSIGLNVLEFLALGIPSLISQESFLTFPELKNSPLIQVVDWDSLSDVKVAFEKAKSLNVQERMKEAKHLFSAISIEKHMNTIVEEFGRDI